MLTTRELDSVYLRLGRAGWESWLEQNMLKAIALFGLNDSLTLNTVDKNAANISKLLVFQNAYINENNIVTNEGEVVIDNLGNFVTTTPTLRDLFLIDNNGEFVVDNNGELIYTKTI